ncbi:MAG: hypothetical protein OEV49_06225 [candidate division Zixibacteria bacterium]|nr:hypothetical protein [candidate division Zixibacteria bacterium]MDH3936604.1 hypothetical protein [candidate division Zixibacteria bacterium]MDH4034090.1 hypothetical protein [candidate division Zixibacteria bacterium]
MSQVDSLRTLEKTLESFLDRALAQKEKRLSVLDGINRLDEIARDDSGASTAEAVGNWFARHNQQLKQGDLKSADIDRIGGILKHIKSRLSDSSTPETAKLTSEIDRWDQVAKKPSSSITLKRPPESQTTDDDSISLFGKTMARTSGLFLGKAKGRKHLLSILDESLNTAALQKNREALLLSGFIIYYLKIGGYKVEPFVKRLKEAEQIQKESAAHA